MTETRVVIACPECQTHWQLGAEEARCTNPDHEPQHQRFEVHRHLSMVKMPDGTDVMAASFDPADPYGRNQEPEYGLYLDHRWQPPWSHDVLDWPDFGVPEESAGIKRALIALLERARNGQRVEVGCYGGHGRTGTALACLAVLTGCAPGEAIGWVRTTYCAAAVETPDQEAFVLGFMD